VIVVYTQAMSSEVLADQASAALFLNHRLVLLGGQAVLRQQRLAPLPRALAVDWFGCTLRFSLLVVALSVRLPPRSRDSYLAGLARSFDTVLA
jgi:hypothetical protein